MAHQHRPRASAESGSKRPRYSRIMLKLSGEALMGEQTYGLDSAMVVRVCEDIGVVHATGVEICVVVGGGNIYRGVAGLATGVERASADSMGMLATVINALAVQSVLENAGIATRVQSAIRMDAICEPFIRRRAIRHLEKGRIVIFAAGTGNPFFTTDSAAALRATEMNCTALLKATQVDGVYSADPKQDPSAERYERLSFDQVLRDNLKVMDATAISLARENNIPILVFSIHNRGALTEVLSGGGRFTLISDEVTT